MSLTPRQFWYSNIGVGIAAILVEWAFESVLGLLS